MTAVTAHLQVIGSIRLCGSQTGTAVREEAGAVTCPSCRAILQAKAAAHREMAAKSRGAKARFFAADAARVDRILAVAK